MPNFYADNLKNFSALHNNYKSTTPYDFYSTNFFLQNSFKKKLTQPQKVNGFSTIHCLLFNLLANSLLGDCYRF